MSLAFAQQSTSAPASVADAPSKSPLCAMITQDPDDIQKAFQLRYRIFAEEMGANLDEQGIDQDRFDEVCHHLVVKDEDSEEIVGYSRIITNEGAYLAGSYYTQTEFDLSNIIRHGKSYMEIGRTCVAPGFRSGAVIALLWARLGQFMMEHQIDYLMGCASIPLGKDMAPALAIMDYLQTHHAMKDKQTVTPKIPLPALPPSSTHVALNGKALIPALLKAYLRIGCKVCGPAHWDQDFNVADVVVLLDRQAINMRYLKHFLRAA